MIATCSLLSAEDAAAATRPRAASADPCSYFVTFAGCQLLSASLCPVRLCAECPKTPRASQLALFAANMTHQILGTTEWVDAWLRC